MAPNKHEFSTLVRAYQDVHSRDHGGYNILRIDGPQVRLLFFG